MTCPMNCPKTLRNGPCGGVRPDGTLRGQARDALRVGQGPRPRSALPGLARPPRRAARAGGPPPAGDLLVAQPAQRPRPRTARRAGAMSELERTLQAGRFVVTAEMPVINGGGIADVRATSSRWRHTSTPSTRPTIRPPTPTPPRSRSSVGAARRRSGADHAARLPGPQPPRPPGRPGRRRHARRAEHLLHDRRRRDAPATSPRPSACSTSTGPSSSRWPAASPGAIPVGPGARAGAALLHRRGREPERPAAGIPRAPGGQEGRRPARAFCSSSCAIAPSGSSASCARPYDSGLSRATGADALDLHPAHRGRDALRGRATFPASTCRPRSLARVESASDPELECFEIAYELASHALAQPGVAGLHFISFRQDAGIAKLCARLGIAPRSEREPDGHSAPLAV